MRKFPPLFAVFLCCKAAMAASPQLARLTPPGGQRGTEVTVVLEGSRLFDAQEILWYEPGIVTLKLGMDADKKVRAVLKIAPAATLGEHRLRVRTATGISDLRTFWVGAFPVVARVDSRSASAKPQKVLLNSTVWSTIAAEDVHTYAVDCRRGQRLTAEIEGMRLGAAMFDPCIEILDERHAVLDASDDTTLLMQDSIASIICPADGVYFIRVRDAAYAAGAGARYRLHIGTYPRPRIAFPLGGKTEQVLSLHLLGDVGGPLTQSITLPPQPQEKMLVFAAQDGLLAPSPNWVRVTNFASIQEREPNDDAKNATPVEIDPPFAIDGTIGTPGDNDYFRFRARKGQALDVQVWARRLRSPLDAVLYIIGSAGKTLATNDDTFGPDPYIRFVPPADGGYFIRVHDQLRGGGEQFVYRIEVSPVVPSLTLSIPNVGNNPSQERQAIAVPRGGRFATSIRATRHDFSGELALMAKDLPQGVTMHAAPLPAGFDQFSVVFEATADAPLADSLASLEASTTDGKSPQVHGRFAQTIELVGGAPNNSSYYGTHAQRLAVAVVEAAPFTLSIDPPVNPLVQNGSAKLHIRAQRRSGFSAPIAVRLLTIGPGISASTDVSIGAGKTDAFIPISANGGAAVGQWPIAAIGSADVNGALWTASELTKLQVAPAFAAIKIQPARVHRGQAAPLTCSVSIHEKFDGQAKLSLRGLPANTSAEDIQITAADTTAVFHLVTKGQSPLGQHRSLYCTLTLERNGEQIVQTAGQGGILQILPPAQNQPGEKK